MPFRGFTVLLTREEGVDDTGKVETIDEVEEEGVGGEVDAEDEDEG